MSGGGVSSYRNGKLQLLFVSVWMLEVTNMTLVCCLSLAIDRDVRSARLCAVRHQIGASRDPTN